MSRDKKVEVEITHPRNFIVDSHVYGTGGVYPVDEDTARQIVDSGRGKVVKGKLSKAPDVFSVKSNEEFLTMVRRNATEILGILSAEAEGTGMTVVEPATTTETNESETAPQESEDAEEGEAEIPGQGSEGTAAPEKASSGEQTEEIPDDFPGREILNKAGITSLSQIPRKKDDLMKIDQMTGRVANLIEAKLNQ